MTHDELCDWLLSEGLSEELRLLVRLTARSELAGLSADEELETAREKVDWDRLLLAASILARSTRRAPEEAALRIATAAMTLSTKISHKDAAAIIFEQLSNERAVALAQQKEALPGNFVGRLGITARMEAANRRLDNALLVDATAEFIDANRFQKEFWETASHPNSWVSASAPTAAGKTFIVVRWLVNRIMSGECRFAVYLAPTRALVGEIEEALKGLLSALNVACDVTSVPQSDLLASDHEKLVFVCTQERMHLLANVIGDHFKPELVVVDEAHKVGDRLRGVVLQDALERAVRDNPKARIVFLSPSTQNPSALLDDTPSAVERQAVDSDSPTVLQNVILATQVKRKPLEWDLTIRSSSGDLPLGLLKLPSRPTSIRKRLALIAAALTPSGGTLVYANGAAEAEEIALLISQTPNAPSSSDEELLGLADLARKGVHRHYQLAPLVEKGVAFHYGNMPSLLRSEIERLFREGKLKFLVCTSTLVEGVNLSCRTIVVRGPRRGSGQPMVPHDFWNLAGRAGRWGNEF